MNLNYSQIKSSLVFLVGLVYFIISLTDLVNFLLNFVLGFEVLFLFFLFKLLLFFGFDQNRLLFSSEFFVTSVVWDGKDFTFDLRGAIDVESHSRVMIRLSVINDRETGTGLVFWNIHDLEAAVVILLEFTS